MSFLLLDPYKGENPGAFNNPPVNEVLLTALDSETGLPATLTPGLISVRLLQPTQMMFIVTAVEQDFYVCRVKLMAYPDAEIPVGLNLGCITALSQNYTTWGTAWCSINLTDAIPRATIPDPTDDPQGFMELMRIQNSPVGPPRLASTASRPPKSSEGTRKKKR
jgi:hypothetical protein